jgi:hypothetical protein
MRGHIIVEDRFMHQGIDHHLFVTASDGAEHEYRFEVRRTAPGGDHPETIFEKTENLASLLATCPNTTIDQLITAELQAIRKNVNEEEDIHANDP